MAPSALIKKALELNKKQICALASCDYNTDLQEGERKSTHQQALIDLMSTVTECSQCGGQCSLSKHTFDLSSPPFAPARDSDGVSDSESDESEDDDNSRVADRRATDASLAALGISNSPTGSSTLPSPPTVTTSTSSITTTTQSTVTTTSILQPPRAPPPLTQSELWDQLAKLVQYPTAVSAQQPTPFTAAVNSLGVPPGPALSHPPPQFTPPTNILQQPLQFQQFQQFLQFQQQHLQQQSSGATPVPPQAPVPPVLDPTQLQLDALKSQLVEQQRTHQSQLAEQQRTHRMQFDALMNQMRSLSIGAPPPIVPHADSSTPGVPYPPLASSTVPPPAPGASFTNEGLAAACGVIPTQLRSIESSETNYWGHKKKLPSGMYTDNDRDVQQQCRWPHKALDDSWFDKPPEFYDMDQSQFAAGAVATILMQLPADQSNSITANMLKHYNRLFTYTAKFSWKQVLILHHKFMSALEQRTMNWSNWDTIKRWHLLKLESLYASKDDAKPDKSVKDLPDPSKKLSFGVEVGLIKSSNLCVKFQAENCSQDPDHLSPHGGETTLAHHCAWCFHKVSPRVSATHSARNCPERKKSFSARGGEKGATPP